MMIRCNGMASFKGTLGGKVSGSDQTALPGMDYARPSTAPKTDMKTNC
jgi:hypothetical protein